MAPQGAGSSLRRDAGDRPRQRTLMATGPDLVPFAANQQKTRCDQKSNGEVDRFSAAC